MARYELKLPHMGESVAEATITSWLKKVGDTIQADDIIVEVATDKVDSEIPCEVSGVVTEILFNTDQVVQVGQVMAIIETPEASSEKEENLTQTNADHPSETVVKELQQIEKSAQNIVNNTIHSSEDRFYSPLVKTIAQAENISIEELKQIKGSGQDGRVTKNDILEYVKTRKAGGNTPQTFYQEVKTEIPTEVVSPTVETTTEAVSPNNDWDAWGKAHTEETPIETTTESVSPNNDWDAWGKAHIEETPVEATTESVSPNNDWDAWGKAHTEETPIETTTEAVSPNNDWDAWGKAHTEETLVEATTEEVKADNSWDAWGKTPTEEVPIAETTTEEVKVDNSWGAWGKIPAEETPVVETQTEEVKVDNTWDAWGKTPAEETATKTTNEEVKVDNSWGAWGKTPAEETSTQEVKLPTILEEKTVEQVQQKTDIHPVTTSAEIEKERIIVPAFTHKVEFNHQQEVNNVIEKTPEVVAPAKIVSETIATKTPEIQEVKLENSVPPVKEEPKKEEKTNVKQSDDVEVIEMTRMGKLISKYMVESKRTSPHVQSFTEVDVTKIWNWRNKIKNKFEQREGEKFTFTPIFIEAVAKALRDFPMMNISTDGERIFKKKHINIGMATALPNGDLIVPVIKNADTLSLVGLAKTVNDLANRARNNKLKPDDITGGTYTVTNIGSFGNVFGTPIINQPEVGILAIGAIQKVPAVIETPDGDVIGIRYKMMLSHSYDHRVVNGALGGMFVQRVAEYLEKWNTERDI